MTGDLSAERLLLVLPVTVYRWGDEWFIETQAANGLRLWLEHFSTVTLMCPWAQGPVPLTYSPLNEVPGASRLQVVPLPVAYTPLAFARVLRPTVRLLAHQVDRSRYLHFAIGGLLGDWGALAGLIATGRRRPFAVWTDRVEWTVVSFRAGTKAGWRKAYWLLTAWIMRRYERLIIHRATLGLFHGMDCFSAYAKFSPEPHLMHGIHVGRNGHIGAKELATKQIRGAQTIPRLIYVGRVNHDKGVFDWIEVLANLAKTNQPFHATWLGDGPDLAEARERVTNLGLANRVSFPGPNYDHSAALRVGFEIHESRANLRIMSMDAAA